MDKKISFKRNYLLYTVVALIVGLFIYVSATAIRDNISYGAIIDYTEGWERTDDSETGMVRLTRIINNELIGRAINFHTYDSFVTVYIGDEVYYSFGAASKICKSPASAEQIIEIPGSVTGKELTIIISPVYKKDWNSEYTIRMGSSAKIVSDLLKREVSDIVLNTVILILSIMILVLSIQEYSKQIEDKGALFLGIFGVVFFLGSSNDLFVWRYFVPYGTVQYMLYFNLMYILPLILVCYVEELSKYKQNLIFYVHLVSITVLTVLQLTGIAEYTQTFEIYGIIAAIEGLVLVFSLWLKKVKLSKGVHEGLLILVGTVAINAILYLIGFEIGKSLLISKIGICIYMIIAMRNYNMQMILEMTNKKNAEILKKQAFTDHLTELGNRYAFMAKVNSINITEISLVSFDVNNLKYYNDRFGHICGDKLIIKTAQIIRDIYDDVYRIGGDEFMAVLSGKTDEELQNMKQQLIERAKNDSTEDLVIEIACGYSSYSEADISYENIVRRADLFMYDHKKELKAASIIKSIR